MTVKVLAIDDEEGILKVIRRALEREGYEVDTLSDPLKADLSSLGNYDLILLDVMMPGMDGFELLRKIRERADCPILFLTARTGEEDVMTGLGLGADDYIRKPFGIGELRARVEAHIRRENRQLRHHRACEKYQGKISDDRPGTDRNSMGDRIQMERIKRKKKRLYAMFISFLFRFGILAIGLAGLTAVIYMVTVHAGVVRLPSYELDKITRAEGEIRSGGQVDEKLLPDTCRYGVFEKDGTYVYGNLSKEEQEGLWKSQMQSSPALIYGSYWKVIEKENGLTALVEYQVIAKFSNPFLRSVFPNAELLFVGAYFLMFFGTAVALAKRQGKYLQKRLNVLKETAERVEREDLDFEREYSDIQEVDHVLGALYQMKEALQKSLKEQWDIKRQKEDQIASLAHDIKTPLTIIRGNTELLLEEETEEEKREWDQEILDNVREIERYLQILQRTIRQFDGEPNRGSKDGQEEQKNFPASFWIQEICERAQALGRTKKLKICCRAADTDKMIYGRKEECSRALWNIVSNGVDFSPLGGELLIEIKESGEFLAVTVTDDGPGFTKEGLAHATEQFYQADKSRTRKDHYGMGLYIASEIMKEYKGFLQLENEEGRGGKVSLYFRCV